MIPEYCLEDIPIECYMDDMPQQQEEDMPPMYYDDIPPPDDIPPHDEDESQFPNTNPSPKLPKSDKPLIIPIHLW